MEDGTLEQIDKWEEHFDEYSVESEALRVIRYSNGQFENYNPNKMIKWVAV